ncbi:MAG: hypothetical protein ACPGWS_06215 [Solirubrobacterales bacterium]
MTSEAVVTFDVQGREYSVLFNHRAAFMFEKLAGYSVAELQAYSGRASDVEIAYLLLTGLEGHRLRVKPRGEKAWTLDRVLDVVLRDADGNDLIAITNACKLAIDKRYGEINTVETSEDSDDDQEEEQEEEQEEAGKEPPED